MINLIGKWNVSGMIHFDEEKGMVWATKEDLVAQKDLDSEMAMMLDTEALFEDDGSLVLLSPLPADVSQEEIDEALAAGELELKDGKMITGQYHWKVENGTNMADTGMEGEVLGEKVGPWEEVKEIDDHTIQIMTFQFSKAID